MNTIRKLMALLLVMLALTACHNDEPDEPEGPDFPTVVTSDNLYLAVINNMDGGDLVLTAQGDTIYQCAPNTMLERLIAEGSDWYAMFYDPEGSGIIKNGQVVYKTTTETIYDLFIEDGNIYTLQDSCSEDLYQEWVYKNFERIYALPTEKFVSVNMDVENGNVFLTAVHYETAVYWHNGEFVDLPGVEGPIHYGFIDKEGDDLLVGIFEDKNSKQGYWLNGTYTPLNAMHMTQAKLIGGKPYIIGERVTGQVGNVQQTTAIAVIDGQEQMLNGSRTRKLINHSNDVYILVDGGKNSAKSRVYKNMNEIGLGYIKIYDETYRKKYGDSIFLAELQIRDIAYIETNQQ